MAVVCASLIAGCSDASVGISPPTGIADGTVRISCRTGGTCSRPAERISVLDAEGTVVTHSQVLGGRRFRFTLLPGAYVVRVSTSAGTAQSRFVIASNRITRVFVTAIGG